MSKSKKAGSASSGDQHAPSFGLFVEGTDPTDEEGTQRLRLLWEELVRACGYEGQVYVYGFNKSQIELLHPDSEPIGRATLPLDLLVDLRFRQDGFDYAVVAFDAMPPNKKLPHSSLREEVNWVLERCVVRGYLPPQMRADAAKLLKHYKAQACPPRPSGRPPRLSFELLYMDPVFEGMLVSDEKTVRKALGISDHQKDWPKFDVGDRQPDVHILPKVIERASESVRRRVRGTFKRNKHGWAREIIRHARGTKMIAHEIPSRLTLLLQI